MKVSVLISVFVLLICSSAEAHHYKHHHHHHYRTTISSQGVVSNPQGCPRTNFCGCGASVRIFGRPIRNLFLAWNWAIQFPRAEPAPGRVAVRRHHVWVLESHITGDLWLAYDANSGHHQTRIHPHHLAGYRVVDPHG